MISERSMNVKNIKSIVITGGNSGIGLETAKGLYLDGHNIIFGSRNVQKNEEAVQEIKKTGGKGKVTSQPLDLSLRQSIDQFVSKVHSQFSEVDILVNNAGLIMTEGQPKKNSPESGYEMTLVINHFGPFYLTYRLMDLLAKSEQARIINVSSIMHYGASKQLEDLQCNQKDYNAVQQYSISKLFNVMFTVGLNNLIKQKGYKSMKTASLHPGIVDSGFGSENFKTSCLWKWLKCCCGCIYVNQETGARTTLHLCRVPFQEIRSGEYYDSDTRHKEMDKRGRDMQKVKGLWEISEKAYDIHFD